MILRSTYKGVVIQSTKYFLKNTEYRVGRDALARLQISSRTRPRASSFEFGIFNKPIPSIMCIYLHIKIFGKDHQIHSALAHPRGLSKFPSVKQDWKNDTDGAWSARISWQMSPTLVSYMYEGRIEYIKARDCRRKKQAFKSTSFSALFSSALPGLKDIRSEPCVPDSCLPNKGWLYTPCIFECCVR